MVLLLIVGESKIIRLVVCEKAKDNTVRLSCNDNSKVIHIISAMYGRKKRGTCYSCYVICNTNCESQDALRKVKDICEGLSSCHFKADNEFFGAPCPHTRKYVQLAYQCASKLGMYVCNDIIYFLYFYLLYNNRELFLFKIDFFIF